MKKVKASPLMIYVAILIYGLLPRVTVSVGSVNQPAIQHTIVPLVTVSMFIIAYQKLEKGKWEKLNLGNMIVWAYIVAFLYTIVQFIPIGFL